MQTPRNLERMIQALVSLAGVGVAAIVVALIWLIVKIF